MRSVWNAKGEATMCDRKAINHLEYQRKLKGMSEAALRFTIADCKEELKNNPDCDKASYYSDEIIYCGMELSDRR